MKNVILELTRIVKAVAMVVSPTDQVELIVESISQVIGVDVCSLYRINDASEMILLASHGLAVNHEVKLPPGIGLVGLAATRRQPINIADAASHPNYLYVPGSEEEHYRSFCGVPLVRFGEVIGVLVVQSKREQKLSDDNEAFLTTLAAQLALIVSNIPTAGQTSPTCNQRMAGIKGAPGIGIGSAILCDGGELNSVPDAPCHDIESEILQWHASLATVKTAIQAEKAALGQQVSATVSAIFDVYQMLLADQALIDRVELEIRAGQWLPAALRSSIHYFCELFLAMDDPYLKARHEDIQLIGNKLFNAWRSMSVDEQRSVVPEGPVILVGAQLSVSEVANIPFERLSGIVCFEGSGLSHIAVLANAMGVPAVMGVGCLNGLQSGQRLIVDGGEGEVILRPSDALAAEFNELVSKEHQLVEQLGELRDKSATTTDGRTVRLFANIGLMADIPQGLNSGAQGVGLYRTEIPFMMRDSFPTEDEQVQDYRKVFAAYRGKPIYLRTLDIGGDKQLPYFPIDNEPNPALGWRGIRLTLDNVGLLMTQIRAMIRAAGGESNLHILLPMISSTNELDTFTLLLNDACDQLRQEAVNLCRPKIGVMVEVPAAISQLPFWADKIDFISIGSNDLSQYLLALDRGNRRVAARYDSIHPAILHEINGVVSTAKKYKLPLSLCGEMAADPAAVVLLLGMGIRTLSMSAAQLPRIKWLIRSLSIARAEDLLTQALCLHNVTAIRTLANGALQEVGFHQRGN